MTQVDLRQKSERVTDKGQHVLLQHHKNTQPASAAPLANAKSKPEPGLPGTE